MVLMIRKGTEEVAGTSYSGEKKWWIQQEQATILQPDFLYGLTCGYSLEKCGKIGSILSGRCDTEWLVRTIPGERNGMK